MLRYIKKLFQIEIITKSVAKKTLVIAVASEGEVRRVHPSGMF